MPGTPEFIHIYALCDPDTGRVRYIGKSVNPQNRFKQHLKDWRRAYPVYDWIRSLARDGKSPTMKIISTVPFKDWEHEEKRLIFEYRLSQDGLLNLADGGNSPSIDNETRAQNGRKVAALIHSSLQRKRIWSLKQMMGCSLKLGYVTESTKDKLRSAARKRPDLFGEYAAL